MNDVVSERDIFEILGRIEPSIAAAIRAMAATRDELEEATSDGEPFENLGDERIDELRAIIARRGTSYLAAPPPPAEEPAPDDDWRPQD